MPTFDTPNPISATIDLGLGDVRITAGDRATTVVDVRPSDPSNDADARAANATRIDFANEQLLIKAPKLRQWLPRSDGGSIDVTVELPAGSNLDGSAGSADFRCDGRLGTCRIKLGLGTIEVEQAHAPHLKSGAGDITVDRATGAAELTAGSGEVRVRELDSGAVIKNSNGDTWVGAAAGDVRINAANGSIAVDVANAGVVAKTANGDVRLSEVVRGSVALESQIGDLEIGIREGTAAWLDVNARAGKVHNALTAADSAGRSAEKVEVRARTSVGNVVIRRP
jgi:Putative adhesin